MLGDIGAGQFGKAMNNFLLWVNGVALIEAGRLSEANGMDLVKLREALLISSGASDALKNWENVSFIWALKDMQIVAKMAGPGGAVDADRRGDQGAGQGWPAHQEDNPPDWTGRKQSEFLSPAWSSQRSAALYCLFFRAPGSPVSLFPSPLQRGMERQAPKRCTTPPFRQACEARLRTHGEVPVTSPLAGCARPMT